MENGNLFLQPCLLQLKSLPSRSNSQEGLLKSEENELPSTEEAFPKNKYSCSKEVFGGV